MSGGSSIKTQKSLQVQQKNKIIGLLSFLILLIFIFCVFISYWVFGIIHQLNQLNYALKSQNAQLINYTLNITNSLENKINEMDKYMVILQNKINKIEVLVGQQKQYISPENWQYASQIYESTKQQLYDVKDKLTDKAKQLKQKIINNKTQENIYMIKDVITQKGQQLMQKIYQGKRKSQQKLKQYAGKIATKLFQLF